MAEAKEFNIAELMKGVPDLGTERQQIVYLPIEKILPNGDNFYSLDGLDELAGSIETIGLQQPLVVRPIEGGMYELISGHRRRAAILMIRDGGSRQFAEGVPCIIDRGEDSPAVRKFKLLMANNDTRRMTSADQNKQAEELENVLRELEDEGYHFSGRLRDWVAKLSGMSRSKLGRLKVIREKLHPDLLNDYYNKGRMNESVAYAFAQQPQDVQEAIIRDRFRRGLDISGMQADDVQEFLDRKTRPAPAETPASGIKEKLEKETDDYLAKYSRDSDKFFRMLTQRSVNMIKDIVSRLPDGGTRNEGIAILRKRYRHSYGSASTGHPGMDGSPKGLSLFKERETPIFRTWPETYDMLCSVALQLATQTFNDAPNKTPAIEWQTGEPPKDGLYWTKADWATKGAVMRWDSKSKAFRFPSTNGVVKEALPWWPLPEV